MDAGVGGFVVDSDVDFADWEKLGHACGGQKEFGPERPEL